MDNGQHCLLAMQTNFIFHSSSKKLFPEVEVCLSVCLPLNVLEMNTGTKMEKRTLKEKRPPSLRLELRVHMDAMKT